MNIDFMTKEQLIILKKSIESKLKQICDHKGNHKYTDGTDGDYVYCSDCGEYLYFKRYPSL